MLISKILRAKKLFTNLTGESIIDLISATFKYSTSSNSAGTIIVNEYEVMRPDLISDRIYSNYENWDVILKFNGISNPFSLDFGEVLLAPPFNEISTMISPPINVVEKGKEPAKKNESKLITPKTPKDKQRLDSLRTKVSEVVPPNFNLTGSKNIKVVDGDVIFGGDMTQTSTTSVNSTSTRARIKDQLKNNPNF
ncbi:hypothetical protein UFOVP972_253 [uncultured Caudovirales phage]|uniref:Uncharacterized protein n=1 Tax=uncultured Caudovirales phage TaxID=2100421 RepID=A0A6J5Q7L4_9CAUD|nr:hypothetical protein UFOVP972_253 [uncultured Caudovirales phage]